MRPSTGIEYSDDLSFEFARSSSAASQSRLPSSLLLFVIEFPFCWRLDFGRAGAGSLRRELVGAGGGSPARFDGLGCWPSRSYKDPCTGQPFDQGCLLAAGVVEVEGSAQLLQTVPGVHGEEVRQGELPGDDESIHELVLHPAVGDLKVELLDGRL